MGRKNLIRTSAYPYHITARAHNKVPFPISGLPLWEIAQKSLSEAFSIHPIELISFVLMDNHYHMFLYTPDSNLDSFLYEFNKRLALKIQKQSGRMNQVFGGRYKWCLVQSSHYLLNCYRYIYQNPLRARIVSRCEDYELSTLYVQLHQKNFSVPIVDHFNLLDKAGLEWLNRFSAEENTLIKKGLKKSIFQDY